MAVLISSILYLRGDSPKGKDMKKALSSSHCVAVNSITRGAVQTLVEYYDWEMG